MTLLKRILQGFCRLLLGLTFVFSGLVKGIDPWGSAYKLQDYFSAFHLDGLFGAALILGIALAVVELFLGLLLLFGQWRRVSLAGVGVFMLLFTPLTLYLALANPISDCGCFGDALKLTNWQTFYKNVVLLGGVLCLWFTGWRKQGGEKSRGLRWSHGLLFLLSLFAPLYALVHLPLVDFRPYAVGVHVGEAMRVPEDAPQDEYATTFWYEKDGVTQEFDENTYPWDDTTWSYVSSESKLVKRGYIPPIGNFRLEDAEGVDVTSDVVNAEGASLWIVAPYVEDVSEKELKRLRTIVEGVALPRGMRVYLLTSSDSASTAGLYGEGRLNHAVTRLQAEERILKTVVRAHPGLVLLSHGLIVGKWCVRDFPLSRFEEGDVVSTQMSYLWHARQGLTWKISIVLLCLFGIWYARGKH